ncbi:two pore domain potassium channel family protein [Draconibacterium mangrovi]|uniref:two pore domain potassium channel family protein n=1 Tax=Draconibacterium mangrovi TaxID=2697469 RepID=UPI0013D53D5F|nr:two pore domain potassium channel family protein [Draconibacterium mangrovi]
MSYILIAYFGLIIFSVILSFSRFRKIIKDYKKNYDRKDPEKWLSNNLGSIDVDELKETKIFIISKTKSLFSLLHTIINFPIFILRMALIIKFGIRIVWKLPIQIYEIWWIFIYAICFNLARNGSLNLSVIFSSLITFSIIIDTASIFDSKKGRLNLMDKPDHKIRLYDLLVNGLLIIIGFACIYFTLSIININAFGESLSILDSIFYSFMIGTTIGFSNILPVSDMVKIITMIEGLLGFMFVVIMIGIFINVWIDKKSKTTANTL